jgi:hypothetical protein
MLQQSVTRKNKIDLQDYNFKRDIENRLLMSEFSTFDVEVLEEVLHSSIKFTVDDIADALDSDQDRVTEVLDRLSQTGLLSRNGGQVQVDKEMRKYYDFQIDKFDDDFEPDMLFLQGLLRKVPIHVLPTWYSIPRASANIFESIVERFLLTPRIYQRYQLELDFEDEVLTKMMQDVFNSPDFKVRASELRERYNLTHEQFEEYTLLLEFHFVCCLSYSRFNGKWEEVVTPFHEWREYLRFLQNTCPQAIEEQEQVVEMRGLELAFATDMRQLLHHLTDHPIAVDTSTELPFTVSPEELELITSKWEGVRVSSDKVAPYLAWILSKMELLGLAEHRDGDLILTDEGAEWRKMTLEDIAHCLYRHRLNRFVTMECPHCEDRLLRDAEKALTPIARSGWVLFDDFVRGFHAPISEGREVTLKKVGRKWSYVLPTHADAEKTILRGVVFERFFESGFVTVGMCPEGACFSVTDFGRHILSL